MPAASTLLLFSLAALVLIGVPGPNHVYIVTRSATQGRAAGVASSLGVEAGTLVHIVAATAGLSALVASSAVAFDVVRYLGAAYLVVLGVRAWRERPPDADVAEPRRVSHARLFRDGLLVNVLNPKVALFFLAFLPQFVDPERGSVATQTLVLGGLLSSLGLLVNILYVVIASSIAARLRGRDGPGGGRLRRLTAGVYVSLGAVAALAGGRG